MTQQTNTTQYYSGTGQIDDRGVSSLPAINHAQQTDGQFYRAPKALAAAVDTAISLGMPLLLTGEPGSGKSSLAESVAWELSRQYNNVRKEPICFTTKSDTRANDLFYRFDTVGYFRAGKTAEPWHFLSFTAIGQAIIEAKSLAALESILGQDAAKHFYGESPQKSIVLIDEIDKAPRDVPNDMLVEIDKLAFSIPELGIYEPFGLDEEERGLQPIVIFTSNSEKSLPDAFMRRCVFHHLDFPPFQAGSSTANKDTDLVTVQDIVSQRLGARYDNRRSLVDEAIAIFKRLRQGQFALTRKPSIAELLNWLAWLIDKLPADQSLADMDVTQCKQSICHLLAKQTLEDSKLDQLLKLQNS